MKRTTITVMAIGLAIGLAIPIGNKELDLAGLHFSVILLGVALALHVFDSK